MCGQLERCHRFAENYCLDNQDKSTLKKYIGGFSETSAPLYKLIAGHVTKDSSLYAQCRQNFKSCTTGPK
jgi:hypothetical protein